MEYSAVAVEAVVEATHWWFVGRRRLFSHMIKRCDLAAGAEILDVGTGTGANLRMLRDMGFVHVMGIDSSPEAARYCQQKGLGSVQLADVCALPFPDGRFDFIMATDVIEHVDEDDKALNELRRVLKPGGKILLTVPTFHSLWGLQDDFSHHKRRYRMPGLLAQVKAARFQPTESFYFNYLLFVPIFLCRQVLRLTKPKITSEFQINWRWLNWVLLRLFEFDVWTAPGLHPPFGISALVMATPARP